MNKIILALDTTNLTEAIDIAKKVKNKIFTIKLGLEFFNAHGKEGVKGEPFTNLNFNTRDVNQIEMGINRDTTLSKTQTNMALPQENQRINLRHPQRLKIYKSFVFGHISLLIHFLRYWQIQLELRLNLQ